MKMKAKQEQSSTLKTEQGKISQWIWSQSTNPLQEKKEKVTLVHKILIIYGKWGSAAWLVNEWGKVAHQWKLKSEEESIWWISVARPPFLRVIVLRKRNKRSMSRSPSQILPHSIHSQIQLAVCLSKIETGWDRNEIEKDPNVLYI